MHAEICQFQYFLLLYFGWYELYYCWFLEGQSIELDIELFFLCSILQQILLMDFEDCKRFWCLEKL